MYSALVAGLPEGTLYRRGRIRGIIVNSSFSCVIYMTISCTGRPVDHDRRLVLHDWTCGDEEDGEIRRTRCTGALQEKKS